MNPDDYMAPSVPLAPVSLDPLADVPGPHVGYEIGQTPCLTETGNSKVQSWGFGPQLLSEAPNALCLLPSEIVQAPGWPTVPGTVITPYECHCRALQSRHPLLNRKRCNLRESVNSVCVGALRQPTSRSIAFPDLTAGPLSRWPQRLLALANAGSEALGR
jgi:hypothetical protein